MMKKKKKIIALIVYRKIHVKSMNNNNMNQINHPKVKLNKWMKF